jgi:hypothetical protein
VPDAGLPLSPIEFLYSAHGVDFYSVIFKPATAHVGGNTPNDISLILVYQDEALRQQMIDSLRHSAFVVRKSDATPASLDNFKFAVMHCMDGGKELLSAGRCAVSDIQYFKLQACIVVPQAKSLADLSVLSGSGARNYRDAISGLNWLTGTGDIYKSGKLHIDLPSAAFGKLRELAAKTKAN